jgi:NAD(P)-dependent dehydrogenase (short-subunit alcohol dehydrogenase family)
MGMSTSKRTAFVTGASYGVGAATAVALAQDGFDVAISATRAAHLDATLAKIEAAGRQALPLVLDLRLPSSIEQAMADIASRFGRLDVLVNNAAINLRKLAVDVTLQEWDEVMATNLRGAFFLTQQIGRHLIASGRPGAIVNVASTHGLRGAAERTVYGISKGALIQMTRMLAIEWAEHGIRVNAVAPGRLETPSPSRAARTGDPEYLKSTRARIPLKRLATVEEVAAAVSYLASPQAMSITGQTLVLDGGMTIAGNSNQ